MDGANPQQVAPLANGQPLQNQQIPIATKQQLESIYQRMKAMKENGQENDETYKKLAAFLKLQLEYQKRQQLANQRVQTQLNNLNSQDLNQQIARAQQPSLPIAQNVPQPQVGPLMTQLQKDLLKAQIYAFKNHIIKREALPDILNEAIKGINTAHNLQEYERVYMQQQSQQSQQQPIQQPLVQPKLATPIQQPTVPSVQPQPSQSNIQANMMNRRSMNQQTQNINSALANMKNFQQQQFVNNVQKKPTQQIQSSAEILNYPRMLDIKTLLAERNRRVEAEKTALLTELNATAQNPELTQEEQLKYILKIRQLELLQAQRAMRAKIYQEMVAAEQLKPSFQQRHQNNIQPMITRRVHPDQEKNKKQKEFLRAVTNHQVKFREKFKNIKVEVQKLNKSVLNYHEKKAKREREEKARQERARLKALKENDAEAYFKLLADAKVDRIAELIKETDQCLAKLGAQLKIQTNNEGSMESLSEEDGSNIYQKYMKNQQAYYELAHKFKEKIDKQPTMLKGGDLKEYQRVGLDWLVSLYNNNLNGILADEMGLGKTIQTIALVAYLMEKKNNKGPHLVVVPLSTIDNWKNEFKKWAPEISVVVYGGNQQNRKKVQAEMRDRRFNVLITQYEYINRDKNHLTKVHWDYIIIDEGHRIKNQNCKLVQSLSKYKSKHRLLLTGTPLQNDLTELWSLLHFLLPSIFTDSFDFGKWFSAPFQNTGEKAEMNEEETLLIINRLHQVLRPFLLRREKSEVKAQLPEKVEKTIRCNISGMQKILLESIASKNSIKTISAAGGKKEMGLQNAVMQMRKACNHPFLFCSGQWFEDPQFKQDDLIRASGKFEMLHRMLHKLKATGHRVLLFSQFTQVLDLIEDYLDRFGFERQYLRLDGAVKAEERGGLMSEFNQNQEQYFMFLLSTRAGGLGLNLQTADTVIIFDEDWNPQMDLQAQARAHRIGQTKAVRVFTFVTATYVEEKIHKRAEEKKNVEGKVIGAGKFNQKSTHQERQELLAEILKKEVQSDEAAVPTKEEFNELIARSEEEYQLFQKMDDDYEREREMHYKKLGLEVPAPLMTEDEVPAHWKINEEEAEAEEEQGRGRRKSTLSSYKDLSEREFEGLMEGKYSGYEDVIENRKRKRDQSKSVRFEEGEEGESGEEEEEPQQSSSAEKKTKTGKQPTGKQPSGKSTKSKKRKVVEEESESDQDISLKDKLTEMFSALADIKAEDESGEDRRVCELFEELPARDEYADYYQIIQKPISLNVIKKKINKNQYSSLEEFEKDIKLLVNNAQIYNQNGSIVYNDSILIWNTYLSLKKDL